MNLREEKTIKLRMLTPVFIWSGETIKPISYLLEGNTAYVIDEDKFFAQLSMDEQQHYQEWVESLIDPLGQLDDQINQARGDLDKRHQLLRKRREIESAFSLCHFLTNILRVKPIPFAGKCEDYTVRCSVQPERDGFRLCMKDMAHNPYIPGTEVKGAMRTAVLHALINDPGNYSWLKDRLSQIRSFFQSAHPPKEKIKKFEKIAKDLEAKMLRGEKKDEIQDDAKFDFFRTIHVSDSTSLAQSALQVELTQMSGTRRYTKTWVEAICSGSEVSIKIDFCNPNLLLEKLGIEKLHEWFSFSKLLESCYIRSKDILEEEARYFAGEPRLKKLTAQLQQENIPSSPLIRIGQGQGFLGVTVGLLVLKRDKKLYDEAIREGVTLQRRWKTQVNNFPKTRRVITDQGGGIVNILGWCKILS